MSTQHSNDYLPAQPPGWNAPEIPYPDWAAIEAKARADGVQHGQSLEPIALMQEFESLHLNQLDGDRDAEIAKFQTQLQRLRRETEGAQAELDEYATTMEKDFSTSQTTYDHINKTVTMMESGPSTRAGDRLPSTLALSGGGWKAALRHWAGPIIILALLLTVDVPIYYATFLVFGESPVLTYALAIGAILVFVLGPHFYGRSFREWQEYRDRGDRADRRGLAKWPILLFVIPVLWFVSICSIAYMRLKSLYENPPVLYGADGKPLAKNFDAAGNEIPSDTTLLGQLGYLPLLIVFLALMIFTALIATELGRRMGNPNDRLLKEQRANRLRARGVLDQAQRRKAEAARKSKEIAAFLAELTAAEERGPAQIEQHFDKAEEIYVNSLAMTVDAKDDDPDRIDRVVLFGPGILRRHRRLRHELNMAES
ncbi:hypothetical protein Acor_10020 [Acrocarpospora corrugata]|uniref:Uncharacterized protein n=1 Tax=Acrocarpospora corrugata TaxID=35763 RepID=A0A5M3VRW1_9ACTN|nr:hypothetical protein [Acrocarpospora corrugata]GER98938.1 hypothetical protein Acor_10020 [Acrocarpospora corrugata]